MAIVIIMVIVCIMFTVFSMVVILVDVTPIRLQTTHSVSKNCEDHWELILNDIAELDHKTNAHYQVASYVSTSAAAVFSAAIVAIVAHRRS